MDGLIITLISGRDTEVDSRRAASIPPNAAKSFMVRHGMMHMAVKLPTNADNGDTRRYVRALF
jgi:hypothetical protein